MDLVDYVVFKCCSKGCSKVEMEKYCCTEKSCLQRCYADVRNHHRDHLKEIMSLARTMSSRVRRLARLEQARRLFGGRLQASAADPALDAEWADVDQALRAEQHQPGTD